MRQIIIVPLILILAVFIGLSSFKNAQASVFTITQTPIADTYIDSTYPTRNYGTSTQFRIDGSPTVRSYLKFDLSGINGEITKATLKIYANSSHSAGFEIRNVADGTWSENTLTYANAPQADAGPLAFSGSLTAATLKEVDLTGKITKGGNVSFLILTASSTAASLASRESLNPPQLVITYQEIMTPNPTDTPAQTYTPEPTQLETASPTPTSTPIITPVPTETPTPLVTATPVITPVSRSIVMAASDIICNSLSTTSSSCQQLAASMVAVNENPDAVLIVGDLCHTPTANCYNNYYGTSWGQLFSKTYPVTGNHDYQVEGASLYFDYWTGVGNLTGRAGERKKGYYSFDVGDWHFVALNSQCSQAGGCGSTSPQYKWLEEDLKANSKKCTLAYWHIPVFSSGGRANNNMLSILKLLYNYDADVVLNGHDHIYERFAPQNPSGVLDQARGIREFIVGTGGSNHTSIASIKPNSEVRDGGSSGSFGALKLTLSADSYDWEFIPVAGKSFSDSGSYPCH